MVYRFIKILLLSLLISPLVSNSQELNFSELDKYINKSITEWQIPGLAIAVVKDDSVVFIKGFGVREVNKSEKVDENTLFGIASLTKAFTSCAIGILKDEKLLTFDDKVRKHLPYFELYNSYVSSEMTVRDLLCHRSGLKTFSGDLVWYSTNYTRKEIITRARFLKPVFGFRTNFGYSNILFLTAGEIIPALTNKSWDEFLKSRIFEPLKMSNTNTSILGNKGNKNVATPHVKNAGTVIPIHYINWDNIAPAGAINSNVRDMSKWISLMLNDGKLNGKTVISSETLHELFESHTPMPIEPSDKFLFPDMHFHSYALGWDVFDYHGKKIVNHSGGLDGMISHICNVPEEKFGFVVLTNSINYLPDALMYKILDEYFKFPEKDWSKMYFSFFTSNEKRKALSKAEAEKNRNKSSKPTLVLENYVGVYSSELYGDASISLENGMLNLKFLPAPDFSSGLNHMEYDTFTIKFEKFPSLPEGTVHFIINAESKVTELQVDVPNPDFDFTELKFFKVN